MTPTERDFLQLLAKLMEQYMDDFSRLNAAVAALSAKVDAMIAKPAPEPVSNQPAIDDLATQVEAIAAKIP